MNIENNIDLIKPDDIKFDEKTAYRAIQTTKEESIDYFDEIAFHPSLDIKNNILILGFRIMTKDRAEIPLFVAVENGTIQITNNSSFEVNGNRYSIDLKKRKLEKLCHKWSMKELNTFVGQFEVNGCRNIIKPHEVFIKVKNALEQHVDLLDADATLMTVWAIGTYFFPIFSAFPYLHIKAPKGSGKTQVLSFLQQVCFNAVKARATYPALRDTIDSLRGTFLIDQADILGNPNMSDMKDILTDSYKQSGGETRKMVGDSKNSSVEEFQAYSPKAFASIKEMPEDLRDRCVIVSLLRSLKVFNQLDGDDAIWKEIRSDEYKLIMAYFKDVITLYEERKIHYKYNSKSTILVGRRLELWLLFDVMLIFLGVLDMEQGEVKKQFLSNYQFAEYEASDLELAVVEVIRNKLQDIENVVLKPKDIAMSVNIELFNQESFGDKLISEKQRSARIGRIIKKFNLSSEKLPRSNEGERYRFKKSDVENIYIAYFVGITDIEHTPPCTSENEPDSLNNFVNADVHDPSLV